MHWRGVGIADMRVGFSNGSYQSAEFRFTLLVRPNEQAARSPKCLYVWRKGKWFR